MSLAASLNQYVDILGSMLVILLAILPLELIAPAEKYQPWAGRVRNVLYMVCYLLVTLMILTPIFGFIFGLVLNISGGGLLPVFVDSESGVLDHIFFALGFALIWDVWQYCVHRLQHAIPFLWQTHRFHHAEENLNSTSQARTHVSQYVFYLSSYFPLVLLFGGQSPHFIALFVMFRVLGAYNHSNIKLRLGILTPIISGPQWHRIHHSKDPAHREKNFAAIFPFIDIVGGTYYRPKKDEFPATGLPETEKPGYFSDATYLPVLNWYRMFRRNPGALGER